eukprot:5216384-Pyramimonas_sp.AAC.1
MPVLSSSAVPLSPSSVLSSRLILSAGCASSPSILCSAGVGGSKPMFGVRRTFGSLCLASGRVA